ncbi:MAG: nucleotidyltransferase family protein [Burkholderiaceae bacterium]|nr:nucleotidyltransferase family protein [Burkholderiaceae bacterium]
MQIDLSTTLARPRAAPPVSVVWRNQRRLPTYPPAALGEVFGDDDWAMYRHALARVRALGVPFAVGGGLAAAMYTGLWRPSKDLDLYVLPQDAPEVTRALLAAGLSDLHETRPYDRRWIFRAVRDEAIVDVIWAMANGAGTVERRWLTGGTRATLGEGDGAEALPLLAPEEMLWSKLHVVQRDRCDWPDLLNLVYTTGPHLHWARLLHLAAGDERLLGSLLMLFSWIAPRRAQALPDWLWPRLGLQPPSAPAALDRDDERVRLLDTRPWFTGVVPPP